MKYKKAHRLLLGVSAFFMIAALLCSCSIKIYRNDLHSRELTTALCESIDALGQYRHCPVEDYELMLGRVPSDASIILPTGGELGEIGILKVEDEGLGISELTALARERIECIEQEKSAFLCAYAPQELNKLQEAQVIVLGSYVVYIVGDSSMCSAVKDFLCSYLSSEK